MHRWNINISDNVFIKYLYKRQQNNLSQIKCVLTSFVYIQCSWLGGSILYYQEIDKCWSHIAPFSRLYLVEIKNRQHYFLIPAAIISSSVIPFLSVRRSDFRCASFDFNRWRVRFLLPSDDLRADSNDAATSSGASVSVVAEVYYQIPHVWRVIMIVLRKNCDNADCSLSIELLWSYPSLLF